MSSFWEGVSTIVLAIVGLAMVAIIISRRSNTAGVLQAGFSGVANNIGVAISPVTGSSMAFDLSYPGGGGFGM